LLGLAALAVMAALPLPQLHTAEAAAAVLVDILETAAWVALAHQRAAAETLVLAVLLAVEAGVTAQPLAVLVAE
jgi:hypothetical protein